jgi:hypothetical protein
MGCTVVPIPFTYLGLPLGITKPTMHDLMPLVDRIERKMTANDDGLQWEKYCD